ncbi:type 1 glutamine amidotransferase domain-containing protein [Arthrobacter sp. I2-34]|uniref:Type 1 glutamine amidotransferase domain-containing protein n=1 Tax=Arthrobacter hankyongi TaxID=2904801 RepID=A0ABS9L2A5_9MICC|nr:type 1 glutamine amidotransferase domain-containing protein [Arthrobacter hankyongi]MCG2620832.1 type 1 glutamine amidotransferase domain-containing protein [Arthrobacter hankyongi]
MSRILMVVSAADSLTMKDGTRHPTGYWAEELAVSHRLLREAGHSIDIATPGGAKPTVDAISLSPDTVGRDKAEELGAYLREIEADLASPLVLADVGGDYDAIVLPGGHGPMADLYQDPDLGRILLDADDDGLIIAPFCHGPAGLLSAVDSEGNCGFAGRRLTVFTNEEELGGGTGENTPWLVESALREKGAEVETGPAWTSHVVVDGNLISGQNPQSSAAVAHKVLAALGG